MKIFISWSGVRSKHVAEALRWWLPNVIQALIPFMSSHDIQKGARGNVVISDNLQDAQIGIICLTPENLNERWILFESGALSKITSAYVCTYLVELTPSDIEPPLSQFQHTVSTKEETKSLLETINLELKDQGLDRDRLIGAFDTWWPKLEERLKSMPPKPGDAPSHSARTEESKLDELLNLMRTFAMKPTGQARIVDRMKWVNEIKTLPFFKKIAEDAEHLVRPVLFPLSNQTGTGQALVESSLINPAIEQGLITVNNGKVALTNVGWAVVDYYT